MVEMAEKSVSVEVNDGTVNNLNFEITFTSLIDNSMSDTSCIIEEMKSKNRFVKSLLKRELTTLNGKVKMTAKWVVIGDDSPVKSNSTIQCVIKPKSLGVARPFILDVTESGNYNFL
jgi:hypothetical protein